jgi:hypothetical protein
LLVSTPLPVLLAFATPPGPPAVPGAPGLPPFIPAVPVLPVILTSLMTKLREFAVLRLSLESYPQDVWPCSATGQVIDV